MIKNTYYLILYYYYFDFFIIKSNFYICAKFELNPHNTVALESIKPNWPLFSACFDCFSHLKQINLRQNRL